MTCDCPHGKAPTEAYADSKEQDDEEEEEEENDHDVPGMHWERLATNLGTVSTNLANTRKTGQRQTLN